MFNHLNIEVIVNEYSNYVFQIVNRTGGTSLSYQDKEDIVSESFYLLWKNQEKIKTKIKSYLGKIAKNTTYQKLNKIKEERILEEDRSAYLENFDKRLLLIEKISQLTKEEKNIFVLYYVKGYKTKEIAKMVNKSMTNIKVILHRIRKKCKEDC